MAQHPCASCGRSISRYRVRCPECGKEHAQRQSAESFARGLRVFRMRVFEKMVYREIGEKMGISLERARAFKIKTQRLLRHRSRSEHELHDVAMKEPW